MCLCAQGFIFRLTFEGKNGKKYKDFGVKNNIYGCEDLAALMTLLCCATYLLKTAEKFILYEKDEPLYVQSPCDCFYLHTRSYREIDI